MDAMTGQRDSSERARGGMRQREMNRSFVARVFLYGMATGLMIALVPGVITQRYLALVRFVPSPNTEHNAFY